MQSACRLPSVVNVCCVVLCCENAAVLWKAAGAGRHQIRCRVTLRLSPGAKACPAQAWSTMATSAVGVGGFFPPKKNFQRKIQIYSRKNFFVLEKIEHAFKIKKVKFIKFSLKYIYIFLSRPAKIHPYFSSNFFLEKSNLICNFLF